jgi:hypothetical protein
VFVPVVEIGEMRVRVVHGLVAVDVRMRLDHRAVVRMLMVRVVDVAVLMLERGVRVIVLVLLGEVEIETEAHQRGGGNEDAGDRLG